jgi:hypothetical protein
MSIEERVSNFKNILTDQRLIKYMSFTNSNVEEALELYTLNTVLSQSFYVPLQALEIALRNKIDVSLKNEYEEFWFDRPNLIRASHQFEDIGEVKSRIFHYKKKEPEPITHDRLVAGFSFGFWVSMFGHEYEDLWRQILHKIVYEDAKGVTRKTFSGPLSKIRDLRNRIAHHECILTANLKDSHAQIEFLLSLLSKESEF